MNKIKKLLALVPFIFLLIPYIPTMAQIESVHEIELKDMGNGIVIPTSFDVKNPDGSFATLSRVNPTEWQLETVGECYSMKLDNGYTACKKWIYSDDDWSKGYMQSCVYNENDELVFSLGRNEFGQISCTLIDEEGNIVQNIFPADDYKTKDFGDEWLNKELNYNYGDSIPPFMRKVYDAEADTMRVYNKSDDGNGIVMYLREKYEYNHGGDPVCTLYHIRETGDDYTKDEKSYEVYSFKKSNMMDCGFWTGINTPSGLMYGYHYSEIPSVITMDGVDYYFYKVAQRNPNWSTPEERAVLDGKIIECACHFTKEQIEILKKENLKFYDEIEAKYPEFLYPKRNAEPQIIGSPDEKGEGQIHEEEAIAAIKPANESGETESRIIELEAENEELNMEIQKVKEQLIPYLEQQ